MAAKNERRRVNATRYYNRAEKVRRRVAKLRRSRTRTETNVGPSSDSAVVALVVQNFIEAGESAEAFAIANAHRLHLLNAALTKHPRERGMTHAVQERRNTTRH
jgi:hypothetical protein